MSADSHHHSEGKRIVIAGYAALHLTIAFSHLERKGFSEQTL